MKNTKLEKGEIPAAICMYSAERKDSNKKTLFHHILTITRINQKLKSKSIIVTENKNGKLKTLDVNDFPFETDQEFEDNMIETQEESTKKHIKELTSGKIPNVKITSYLSLKTPKNATIEKLKEKLEEVTKTTNGPHKEINIICEILGLKDTTKNNFKPTTKIQALPNKTELEKLTKAAKENELINKYGKKQIEKLAKKMNYKGEIINTQ